jgi:hypothetical protein
MDSTNSTLIQALAQELRPFIEQAIIDTLQGNMPEKEKDAIGFEEALEELNMKSQTLYRHCSEAWRKKNPGRSYVPYHKHPGSKMLIFSRKELRTWMMNGK